MNNPTLAMTAAAYLAISGCATDTTALSPAVGRCSTEGTAWAIGKPADEANGRKLFRQSGAGLWRIITPERAALADYRDDRLNVHVDASNTITAIECK
ncbi:MAG: I78 family peptidase inhibitor [Pseudoxanthomonas sp.]